MSKYGFYALGSEARRIIIICALFYGTLFVLGAIVFYERYHLSPEEKAFETWTQSLNNDDINAHIYQVRKNKKRGPFDTGEFRALPKRRFKLNDNDVKTYMATVPIRRLMFVFVGMTVSSVIVLIDNPNIENILFYYGPTVAYFDLRNEGRKYFKDALLKNTNDYQEDFETFLEKISDSGKAFFKEFNEYNDRLFKLQPKKEDDFIRLRGDVLGRGDDMDRRIINEKERLYNRDVIP